MLKDNPDKKEEHMTVNVDVVINAAIESFAGNAPPRTKAALAKAMGKSIKEGVDPAEASGMTSEKFEWLYAQAYSIYKAGKYRDAIALFKFLATMNPSVSKYYLGLGACYFMLKDYETALFPYLAAANIDKQSPIPLYYVAECFLKLNNKVAALKAYEQLLEIFDRVPLFPHLQQRIRMSAEQIRRELQAAP